MKKLFLLFAISLCSVASWAYDFYASGLYFNYLGAESVEVASTHFGYSGVINIPASVTYNGHTFKVVAIGEQAFYKCPSIVSVTIPNTVKEIKYVAFGGCAGLKSITIPNSVTTIGEGAFLACDGLTSITIPNSVKSIGARAFLRSDNLVSATIHCSIEEMGPNLFDECGSFEYITVTANSLDEYLKSSINARLVESENDYYVKLVIAGKEVKNLVIPSSVKEIDAFGFCNLFGLTSVTIPNGVTSIGSHAFYDCDGLTSITIPNSVKTIGESAFNNCEGLTSVAIPESVTSIGIHAFNNCKTLTSITIPNSVTSIGDCAFDGCDGLTSVTIGNNVTSIGEYAFRACSGLTSVTIGNNVTSIGRSTFEGCNSLTSITIPNSVTSIGEYAFYDCSGLTSITIPNSVKSIGERAFIACSGLTSVTIGNSVTSIGNYAFAYCSGLTSVTIGNSVTSIGEYAFDGCEGLKSISLSANSIEEYCQSAINPLLYSKGVNVPRKLVIAGQEMTDLVVPCTLKDINNKDVFKGMSFATIGISAGSIEEYCQSAINPLLYSQGIDLPRRLVIGGKEVTELVVPCGLKDINNADLFKGMSFTSIGISAGSIEEYCQSTINPLLYSKGIDLPRKLVIAGQEMTDLVIPCTLKDINNKDVFKGMSFATIGISAGSIEEYCQLTINPFLYSKGIDLPRKLVIGGKEVTDLVITEGVTEIKEEAFKGMKDIATVTIPTSVNKIAKNAFIGTALYDNDANWQEGVLYIGDCLIEVKTPLEKYAITEGTRLIADEAFVVCDGLKSIKFPKNSLTTIGAKAFNTCALIKSVSLPKTVTSVGEEAFNAITKVK